LIPHRLFALSLLTALLCPAPSPAQQVTLPLWQHGAPGPANASGPERDTTLATDALIAGRKIIKLTDVGDPTLAVYKADDSPTPRPAVLVFPGGGYKILAYDLEGTEVCAWLKTIHITCVLVKYRVPYSGHFPDQTADLEDAQQALRLTRTHAAEWGVDPARIGVLGFSAGAHLAAMLSIHSDFQPQGNTTKEHGGLGSGISARPDFALILYPGYLVSWPDPKDVTPEARPTSTTPPTFLVQAEDDGVHEENALFYFQALKRANVPAEIHLFAQGGHGYGLRPTDKPVTHWPSLAETWLHTQHVLSQQ
jgi:acetyl esterase/lipase